MLTSRLPAVSSFHNMFPLTTAFILIFFVSHQWYCFLLLLLSIDIKFDSFTVKIKLMQVNLLWKILSWTNTYIFTNTFASIWWNPPQNSLLCDWTTYHWLQGKCARIILSQAASGMILKVPKCENFSLAFFALSEPIWVCDLGSGEKIDFFIKLSLISKVYGFLPHTECAVKKKKIKLGQN